MHLSARAVKAMDAWLGRETWSTWNSQDDERFYKFVRAVWLSSEQGLIDEPSLRELLISRSCELHPAFNVAEINREMGARVHRIQEIMDYHKLNDD